MKRKVTAGIIAIVILICSIVIFRSIYIQRSYYPMGGEVTILAKQADNYGYYITVEQGKPDDAGWGQFELKCTQEQYEAVDVGDVVKCDREQSIVTNSGTVHKIYNEDNDIESVIDTPVLVQSNGVKIEPYVHMMWDKKWSENGWLMADMLSLYDILPEICDSLTEIIYSEGLSVDYNDGVSFVSISIYNSDTFEYIYKNENLSIIDELPDGTYYLGIVVKEQGEYIESEQEYDETGYECVYRLVK